MKRVESYIFRNFLVSFWPLFLTLFAISSLIMAIRLADLTKIANVDFIDFLSLYMFATPQLIFYTLPISFFIAFGLSFSKASFDRELVAIFALGASKEAVIKPVFKAALFCSVVLLFVGYFLQPYSTGVAKNFIEYKKSSKELNIRPTEVGQKFGNWLVFASGASEKKFDDIVLFSTGESPMDGDKKQDMNGSTIILANSAVISNEKFGSLNLHGGKSYRIEDANRVKTLSFEEMKLKPKPSAGGFEEGGVSAYWGQAIRDKKRAKDFADVFLTAMFPLIAIFFIPAVGIKNPRYQKNRAAFLLIAITAMFYVSLLAINQAITYYGIALLAPLWFFAGYFFYKKSEAVRF